ncbi:IS4 family transposase, partial [candidate division KSB1 bacterium]|nr:IS4 family transposase [candidate division KSB1 bacterium]
MNPGLVKFLELLLAASLAGQIKKSDRLFTPATLSQFNRVLVEDSTHIHLPSWLATFYPGSQNATGQEIATLKIRSAVDLLSERFIDFHLSPFTHNDQSASREIVPSLHAGDLLVRDLGFFVLPAFREIASAKAYFISRLRHDVNLYESLGNKKINLLKKLKKYGFVDLTVCVGAHEQFPCRLIAIPVAAEVAAERRRKYKTNRDRRRNPSTEHLMLMGWDLCITNVPPEMLTAQQIAEIYDLRWRIEIIFKSWKSYFNLADVPRANVVRVQAHVYAMLLFITIFQVHLFVKLYRENLETHHTQLSLLKVARFFKENLWALVLSLMNLDMVKEQIFYHCR